MFNEIPVLYLLRNWSFIFVLLACFLFTSDTC